MTGMRHSVGEEGKEKDNATVDFPRGYRNTSNCDTGRTSADHTASTNSAFSSTTIRRHHDSRPPQHFTTFGERYLLHIPLPIQGMLYIQTYCCQIALASLIYWFFKKCVGINISV